MSKKKFVLISIAAVVGAFLGAFIVGIGSAKADSVSYLYRLADNGYRGSDARWLTTGEWICNNQWRYNDYQMAHAIVVNTGAGIYMPEGYQIIQIAREELCGTYA